MRLYTDWRSRFPDEVVNFMIAESVDVLARSLDELEAALQPILDGVADREVG